MRYVWHKSAVITSKGRLGKGDSRISRKQGRKKAVERPGPLIPLFERPEDPKLLWPTLKGKSQRAGKIMGLHQSNIEVSIPLWKVTKP